MVTASAWRGSVAFRSSGISGARLEAGRTLRRLARRFHADDLGVVPLRALVRRNPDLDPGAIDEVFYG